MNTVSLCMIVKNEISNIQRLLDTVCPVLEEVNIVDTGSTDGTLEILQQNKTKYPNLRLEHFEWIHDFSAARNYSFSLATKDWIFWIDGDDSVSQTELKNFKDNLLDNSEVDAWLLEYIYSRHTDGRPSTVLGRERFLRRSKGPRWIGAIHEIVDISNMRTRDNSYLKVVHERDGKVIEPRRNLKILEKEYEIRPEDPRTVYYYGKELFDHIDPRGIEVLERYLTLTGFKHYDDEVNCRFRLARHYVSVGRLTEALQVAEKIYHLDGTRDRAEYYWTYGLVEMALRNFKIAAEWFERCIRIPPPPPRVLNLEFYTWHPHKKLAHCYLEMGNYSKAQEHAQIVAELLPGDIGTQQWYLNFGKVEVPPQGGLRVVEFGDKPFRWDSKLYPCFEGWEKWVPIKGPLDGVVLHGLGDKIPTILHEIKPGGFLWILVKSPPPLSINGFGSLGEPVYGGQFVSQVQNFVKENHNLPAFTLSSIDENFGPSRIRIGNLRKSLVKAGFPLKQGKAQYFISSNLNQSKFPEQWKSETKVLDVCEKLSPESYRHVGIDDADLVSTCSPELSSYIKSVFPNKKVIQIDDHFEVPSGDWL